MSIGKDSHRINCRVPSEECPECLQFLGFKIVAEELKRLEKKLEVKHDTGENSGQNGMPLKKGHGLLN